MIDTERENLRQLFLDFIDNQPDDDEDWDDTDAWKRYLQTYDELLSEVKRLQERLDWILGDEELADYVWEKEVAYMEWEGVRLPWISADEWGEEE